MKYLLILIPITMFSLQFIFVKEYQQRAGAGVAQGFFMNLVCGLLAFFSMFALNGFRLNIDSELILYASVMAVVFLLLKVITVVAVGMGIVAVSTNFYVLGGMLVPFAVGVVFLKESAGILRYAGMALLVVAVLLTSGQKNKNGKRMSPRFFIVCMIIFCANGTTPVVTKIYMNSAGSGRTMEYMAVYSLIYALISAVTLIFLCRKMTADEKRRTFSLRATVSAAKVGAVNTVGNCVGIYITALLPASLMFPVEFSAVMILTAVLAAIIYREKPGRMMKLGYVVTVCAIGLMVLDEFLF